MVDRRLGGRRCSGEHEAEQDGWGDCLAECARPESPLGDQEHGSQEDVGGGDEQHQGSSFGEVATGDEEEPGREAGGHGDVVEPDVHGPQPDRVTVAGFDQEDRVEPGIAVPECFQQPDDGQDRRDDGSQHVFECGGLLPPPGRVVGGLVVCPCSGVPDRLSVGMGMR